MMQVGKILSQVSAGAVVLSGLVSCVSWQDLTPVIPAQVYADSVRQQSSEAWRRRVPASVMPLGRLATYDPASRARLKFVSDDLPPELSGPGKGGASDSTSPFVPKRSVDDRDVVTNNNPDGAAIDPNVYTYHSSMSEHRDYSGPLSVGDPGESASLWRESRGGNDLWRDVRAWQAMDLVTIVITESDEAKKDANTEVKQKSTIALAISKLFGLETQATKANPTLDPTSLINASSQNDFKGEGKADRKDTLKAKMSAMVVEVLPSGILRIEGQKIVTMSSEEQVMIISGLVRPRDVSANNDVDSAKIANMRIDYYGRGTVGESQRGAWGSRLIRTLWPF